MTGNSYLNTLNCEGNQLEYLNCENNDITLLNMNYNPVLKTLIFNNNDVTNLNVSENTELEVLEGSKNQLKFVNIINCPKLQKLCLAENLIEEISITNNSLLTKLDLSNNKLIKLDISKNEQLESLRVGNNQLARLDISVCPELLELDCSYNRLINLDLSNNQKLDVLDCSCNRILFIENLPELKESKLNNQEVYLPSPTFTTPAKISYENGISGVNEEITVEDGWAFSYHQIENVSGTFHIGIPIDDVYFPDANFRSYIASNFNSDENSMLSPEEIEGVEVLYITSKNISDLTGIAYFKNLKSLQAGYNNLKNLDLSGNTALESLLIYGNELTELDVSMLTELITLNCSSCGLKELNVTKNEKLVNLECEDNAISELNLSQNPVLATLKCTKNQLTELDVTANPLLKGLYCGQNQIEELNTENNGVLEYLCCDRNNLKELDLTNNPKVSELQCYENQLTKLLLNSEQYISIFSCNNNKLLYVENVYTYDFSGNDQTVYMPSKTFIAPADMIVAGEKYTKGSEVPVADKDTFAYVENNVSGTFRVGVPITEEFFPDETFRSFVNEKYDTILDEDFLTGDEIAKILMIDVTSMGIESLKGIEHFTTSTTTMTESKTTSTITSTTTTTESATTSTTTSTTTTTESETTSTTTSTSTTTESETTSTTTSTTTTTESETTSTTTSTTTTTESETTSTTTSTTTTHVASDDELCEWAVKDFADKTGVTPAASEIEYTPEGNAVITLTDADGNVLDVYTIDPSTGKGTESDGGNVDLPQTGYAVDFNYIMLAAMAMVLLGILAMAKGRKKYEE